MRKRTLIFLLAHIGFWLIDIARILVYREETPTGHLPSFLILTLAIFYFNFYVLVPRIIKLNKNGTFLLWFVTFIAISGVLLSSWRTFAGVIEVWDLTILLKETALNIHTGFYYGGVSLVLKLSHDWLKNQEFNESLILKKTNIELQYMKSNINIPFMVNVLDVSEEKAKEEPAQVADSILQLSNVLRYGLYEAEEQVTTVSAELEVINDYLSLAKITKPNLKITLDIKAENNKIKTLPNFIIKVLGAWLETLNTKNKNECQILIKDYLTGYCIVLPGSDLTLESFPRPDSTIFSISYIPQDTYLEVIVIPKKSA